jgi:hypothetical protein
MAEPTKPKAEQPKVPPGSADRERTIGERAYAIWQEEGEPEGKHHEHWLRAEQECGDDSGSAASPPQTTKS